MFGRLMGGAAWLAAMLWGASASAISPEFAGDSPRAAQNGTLLLIGGGGELRPLEERFFALAGGSAARVVYIPTATQYFEAERDDDALYGYWRSQPAQSFQFLHTREPAEAARADFFRPLDDATGVWIGGGSQANLARIYGASELPRRLSEVLARGGVVAGTSAGASIMSRTMIVDETPQGLWSGLGFGLCPATVVDCHFSKRERAGRMLRMLERYPDHSGIGIDDDTALLIQGERATVIGGGSVTFFARDGATNVIERIVLQAGAEVELVNLRPATSAAEELVQSP